MVLGPTQGIRYETQKRRNKGADSLFVFHLPIGMWPFSAPLQHNVCLVMATLEWQGLRIDT
jgi:hypothetical protein